ncbi:hypothetical protein GUY44_26955 [Pimelobacter simplex]|uniref:hypothetical protein n=1 Tax=Nocardioides simplex TaxID=2045 RepID=UPI001EFA812A|nr:hypothetical protein [Pimelobacter simplex]MCG8154142.1 hypothetical protein [Pimelobacter simplex]
MLDEVVLLLHMLELLGSIPDPSPSPGTPAVPAPSSPGSAGGPSSGFAPYATLIAAVIAAAAVGVNTWISRRTATQTLQHSKDVADAAASRAHADALAKRYQDAAAQLGHEQPAVRLAGAYAMARLADDWPEQRQTCVDVLCAYLRMTVRMKDYETDGYPLTLPDDGDVEVRRAICESISSRCASADQSGGSWSPCDFNLRNAYLPDFSLRRARLDGNVILVGAQLVGRCDFTDVYLGNGMDCQDVIIEGNTRFRRITLGAGKAIVLLNASVRPDASLVLAVQTPRVGEQSQFTLGENRCQGSLEIQLAGVDYEPGTMSISRLRLPAEGEFRIGQPTMGGGRQFPKIRAVEWMTEHGAAVVIPPPLLKAKRFEGIGWTGDMLPDMHGLYGDDLHVLGSQP